MPFASFCLNSCCCCLGHCPAGYFRGLAHIAGFLLIVMGLDQEQQAFWTLAVLLEDKLFPYCGGQVRLGTAQLVWREGSRVTAAT
jgi:hypothetical protein